MTPVHIPWGGPQVDDEIVETLFDSEYDGLVRAAKVMLDTPEDAEEVVQEAFTRLLTSRRRMRDIENAPAYLRAVVFNLCRSQLRKRRTRRASQGEMEHNARLAQHTADTASPEGRAVASDQGAAVLQALDALPVRQRECLVLRYYLSLPEAEIARTLGISKGSVKTHTSRAMAALQRTMEAAR